MDYDKFLKDKIIKAQDTGIKNSDYQINEFNHIQINQF